MPPPIKVMSVLDLRPRKLGSFEEYTIALSRRLTSERGQSVLVFKEQPPATLRPRYVEAGAQLETKSFVPFGLQSARQLTALVRRHTPDVIHLHFVNLLSLDVIAAFLSGARIILSDHTSDVPGRRSALRLAALRIAKRLFASMIHQVVAPSNYVRRRVVHEGVPAHKTTTLYNGVNLAPFQVATAADSVRARYGLGPTSLLVVSISQLIPAKGIADLIDAASLVLDMGVDVTFVHIGDGPYLDEYRTKVHGLRLQNRFHFTGLLNMPEIASILRAADIFTLPCTWGEAFSLVILEALAAGKPIIATRTGGNEEAVEDGQNGLLIPPHRPPALASAILELHSNPTRRQAMALNSARRAHQFSVERWVDDTLALYDRLLSRDHYAPSTRPLYAPTVAPPEHATSRRTR
jgi:glycosyltransferase involved in cell wall biosynthesis